MKESVLWENARSRSKGGGHLADSRLSALFERRNLRAMLFLVAMYGIWNLWAGTNGFFFPYILRTVGSESQAHQRGHAGRRFPGRHGFDRLRLHAALGQSEPTAAVRRVGGDPGGGDGAARDLSRSRLPVALAYLFLVWFGSGFGAQSLLSNCGAPSSSRHSCAARPKGSPSPIVRIGLGLWSFFVPVLTATGFTRLAWILTGFLVVSGVIGVAGRRGMKGSHSRRSRRTDASADVHRQHLHTAFADLDVAVMLSADARGAVAMGRGARRARERTAALLREGRLRRQRLSSSGGLIQSPRLAAAARFGRLLCIVGKS